MTPHIHRLLTFTMILWLCLGIGAYFRVPEIIQKAIAIPSKENDRQVHQSNKLGTKSDHATS